MIVIAISTAGAVAPLTTAVLMSVDARHTGSASGFNSAVARTGGLVVTALIGSVMAAKGLALISAFAAATVPGAVLCVAAALSAFLLIAARLQP
jgi:hypothetical protein